MPRYGEGSVVGQSYEASQPPGASPYLLGTGAAAGGGVLLNRAIRPQRHLVRRYNDLTGKQVAAVKDVADKTAAVNAAKFGQRGKPKSQLATAQRNLASVQSRRSALGRSGSRMLSTSHRVKVGTAGAGLTLAGLGVLANTTRRPS